MRAFSFLFVLQIFFFLAQPCQELAASVNDCRTENTTISHIDRSNDAETGADLCSPFCICSCCSVPVSETRFSLAVTVAPSVEAVRDSAKEYTSPASTSYISSIWQPPKA